MTCSRCGSYAQGGLCRQCEVEQQYEHLADELASDDDTEGDDD